MTGAAGSGDDAPVDPWARGGAMEAVPDTDRASLPLSFESVDGRSGQDGATGPTTSNRTPWLVGGAAVVLLALVAVMFAGRGPDDPPEPGEAVDLDVETFPDVPDPTEPPAPRATPLPLLADPPPATLPSPGERLVLAASPRQFVVEVAPELAGVDRTEIIGLFGDDGLYEVSLPSGRVRVTDLGFPTDAAQVVSTDQVAVIWPTPEGAAQIISTQRSVAIPEARVDRVSWSPGTDRIYLWGGRSFDNGYEPSVLAVGGEAPIIQTTNVEWVDDPDDPAVLLGFDGELLRADTGGTFTVDPDGTDLLTSGDVIANGANHLLVRECDDQRVCRLVSIGRDGERNEWSVDIPGDVVPQALAGLSPAGDALIVTGERLSADIPSALQILELTDGSLLPLQVRPIFERFASWDTNGAGVFYADQRLLYFDRFVGEPIEVSEELPRLRSVRTRRPADTPLCEMLEIALPRFDEMAAEGIGNTIGAPEPDVLERVVELATEDLRDPARVVADFVNEFVSPDVADSQTVDFWPGRVTDGIAALDDHAEAECRFADR